MRPSLQRLAKTAAQTRARPSAAKGKGKGSGTDNEASSSRATAAEIRAMTDEEIARAVHPSTREEAERFMLDRIERDGGITPREKPLTEILRAPHVILPRNRWKQLREQNFSVWGMVLTYMGDARGRYSTFVERRKMSAALGDKWEAELLDQAVGLYTAVQRAMASGYTRPLYEYTSAQLMHELQIWARTRAGFLRTNRIDWKLHTYSAQLAGISAQEYEPGKWRVEAAVHLDTLESTSIQNAQTGALILAHKPAPACHTFVYTREMSEPHAPWKLGARHDAAPPSAHAATPVPRALWVTAAAASGLAALAYIAH